MTELTDAQRRWLADHPHYDLCGRGKFGVGFKRCGALFKDGNMQSMSPDTALRLEEGCVLIGIPCDPNKGDATQATSHC
jgi:hypothetical protein